MRFYRYKLKLKHDGGLINVFTVATSAEAARQLVMNAERCPRRAILKTTNIRRVA